MGKGFSLSRILAISLLASLAVGYVSFFTPVTVTPIAEAIVCPTSLPGDMVSYWTGDNTTNDSAGTNHGSLTNGATYNTTGKVNQAFLLDGVNDYVTVPHSSTLNIGTNNFTTSAWVKTAVTTNSTGVGPFNQVQTIISKRNASGANNGFILYLFNGVIGFAISDGSNNAFNPSLASLADNTFHHVVLSVDRSSTTGGKVYVDGTDVYTFNPIGITGSINSTSDLFIGQDTFNPNQVFQGSIDEVRLFTRALSASQVKNMYILESGGCSSITSASDTLSTAANGTVANHTVVFTSPAGVEAGQSITLTLASGFSIPSGLDFTDVDLSASTGGDRTLAATPSGATWGVTKTGQSIRFLSGTGTIAAGDVITIEIGTNATAGTTGDQQITNPSTPAGYTLEVGSTFGEVGNITMNVSGVNCVAAPSGLSHWWPGDDNTLDRQGSLFGTLKNGATFILGKVASAFTFDGTDDYVDVGTTASTAAATMIAWIKPDGTSYTVNQAIMAGQDAPGSNVDARYMMLARANELCGNARWGGIILSDGSSTQTVCSSEDYNSTNFPSSQWTLAAITYDGTNVKHYRNGALVTTTAQTVSGAAATAKPYSIGRDGGYNGYYFRGAIDEPQIYTTALSASQINSIYTAGASGVCKPTTSVSGLKDTLTREKISTTANHTLQFTTPSGVSEDATMTFTLPGDFGAVSAITEDDVDVQDDGVDITTAATCSGSEKASVSVSDQTLTVTICNGDSGAIAAGSVVTIKIGTHATSSGTGTRQIVNPSVEGSYTASVGGTFGDSGSLVIPIVDTDRVGLTAVVPPTITFDIDTGTAVGETAPPYTVGLGTLSSSSVVSSNNSTINSIYLNLDTNAMSGATVTVKGTNGGLRSNTVSNTVTTSDGGSAVGLVAGTEGFGLCIANTSVVAGSITKSAPYNGTCNSSTHNVGGVTTSARSLLTSAGAPVDGTADNTAEVMVKASISSTTEAAVDYSEVLTFIATAIY